MAGGLADLYLYSEQGVVILAWVDQIGDLKIDDNHLIIQQIQQSIDNSDIDYDDDNGNKYKIILEMMGLFYHFSDNESTVYYSEYHQKIYDRKGDTIVEGVKDVQGFKKYIEQQVKLDRQVDQLIEKVNIRCPDQQKAIQMIELVKKVK